MKLNITICATALTLLFVLINCKHQKLSPTDYNNKMVEILSPPITEMHNFWSEATDYIKIKDSLKSKVYLEHYLENLSEQSDISKLLLIELGAYKDEKDFYNYSLKYLDNQDSIIDNDLKFMIEGFKPIMESKDHILYLKIFKKFRRIESQLKQELDSVQLNFIKKHNIKVE